MASPHLPNAIIIHFLILAIFMLTPTLNQSCMLNYQYQDSGSGSCLPCPASCFSCFDSTACTSCNSQYYLTDSNTCETCPFGCSVCTDANTCTTCIQGLYITAEGTCISCALGVESCTIAMIQSCQPGYFMLGSICAGCFSNCNTCQDFVTCTLCNSGYYVASNSSACLPCPNNCMVCQSSSVCTSCAEGYILSGSLCVLPDCSSVSSFCQKCTNGICEECQFGTYLNSDGTCSQGASLLCSISYGPYYTNCQTNVYGCPKYAQVQTDINSGTQLPVCLPLHATQNQQYQYNSVSYNCLIASATACSSPKTQQFVINTLKPYYKLAYHISLNLYSNPLQNLTVSYIASNGSALYSNSHSLNLTKEFNQNLMDIKCYNCKYGYTIITGELMIPGGTSPTTLQLSSSASLFIVSEILIKISICKVPSCTACTTAIDCTQCQTPYFLQLISCVKICDAGFYRNGQTCILTCPSYTYPIQSSYQCESCVSPCLTCSSQSECLSCIAGYFLEGTSCSTNCSNQSLFTNITSQKCEACPNPCTKCSIDYDTQNNSLWSVVCTGCGIGYLLQEGNCTFICPIGTFPNFVNNQTECSSCQTGCSQCAISLSICLSCVNTFLLYDSICYSNFSCPDGYFANSTLNSCDKCHYPCQICSNTATNCTSCLKGSLYNNACPLECPLGMYIQYNQNQQICQTCVSPCAQCISQSVCTTCINGTYLYNGECLIACPVQTYYAKVQNNSCVSCQPPCLQCINATACLSCTTGYIDLATHTCKLQCDSDSYPDANFICQLCPAPCIQCYSAASCTMCSLPYALHNQTCITEAQCYTLNQYVRYNYNYSDLALSKISAECAQCTYPCASCNRSSIVCTACTSGYILVPDLSICVEECPQGYYNSNVGSPSQCLKCNSNCLSCISSATYCITCGSGTYLNPTNNTCSVTCPSQYYGSNENQLCVLCQSPCLECYNAYLCKSCSVGIYYNKACVSSCPSGSILNSTSNQCDLCTNNCLTCQVLASNCTECPSNGFYFYQFTCLTSCPAFYYPDDMSGNCQPCIQPCKQCSTDIQCTSCVAGYYLLVTSSSCVVNCPDGYYTDSLTSSCLACNTTICHTCKISPNNCIQCATSYYYDSNSLACVQVCSNGTYADTLYQQCTQCRYPCLSCASITVCYACESSYKLYLNNCYSSCPIGYYADGNNTCAACPSVCQICTSSSICVKCIPNYYVNASKVCVTQCESGYYPGYDPLTSYSTCLTCPSACTTCSSSYNCTNCISGYFLFNYLCVSSCPSLYYQLTVPSGTSSCEACPQYCDQCINSTYCQSCLNSYMYNNLCYLICPNKTYVYNEQSCLNCSSPCQECSGPYSCITCISGYFYFQNYCVQKCPSDVWTYPNNGSCGVDCPYNKYVQEMLCFISGCGGMLVQLNGYCLDNCPTGYYVDQNQNCISCSGSSMCSKIFMGDLKILRSYNLRAVICFNQLINYENVNISKIQTLFYDKNDEQNIISYLPYSITVDKNMIMLQFGYKGMQLYALQVKIPYVTSMQSEQSIITNNFVGYINSYDNYQYESLPLSTASSINYKNTTLQSQLSLTFNTAFSPNIILNALAIVLPVGCFLCLAVNIITKGTHYRQLLDFLQFVAAILYMEIQYPPILESYLKNLRISLFSFLPQIANFQPYAFSPSKLIQYHKDSSLLRSQGLLLIIFILTLAAFVIVILINKFKPQLLGKVVERIKYRNIVDLFSIVSFPLLIFSFRVSGSQAADIFASVVVIVLVVGFLMGVSYILITAKKLHEITGIAGELQQTKSVLGHLYTPFSFIRKIIFAMVVCIQPDKPISNLTLLLIFTILIMVCLFFYEPFQNRITDFVSIGMETSLVIYVILIIMFGLNAMSGIAGKNLGIITVVVTIIPGFIGLGWLVYLTYGGIVKFKKQLEEQVTSLQQGMNVNAVAEEQHHSQNKSAQGGVNVIKITSAKNGINRQQQHLQDEPSANQLIKDRYNKRPSRIREEEIEIESNQSGSNKQQFRHWNNSESDDHSQTGKPPKYLLKIEANRHQNQE